jgi:hypothetical protein
VQHYDNQFRRADVIGSRTALYRLLEVKAALMAALSTLPFKLYLVFLKDLGYILSESPYERIRKMSRPTKKLAKAFHYDLAVIHNARKALRTPYKAITYYQAIRYKGEYVTPIANSIDALWQDMNQMIDFPPSFVSAHQIIRFKKYIFHLCEFYRTILDAHKDLFVLRLRRNPVSARQGIFNAIHHDFTYFNDSIQEFNPKTLEWVEKHRRRRISASRRQSLHRLRDNLFEARDLQDELMYLYHEETIPIITRHLELMSDLEIRRQLKLARSYWLTHWQTQRKNERRLANIEAYRKRIREARNEHRRQISEERRNLKVKQQKAWYGREKSEPSLGVRDQHRSGYKHKNSNPSANKHGKNSKRLQPDSYPSQTSRSAGEPALYAHEFTQDARRREEE